MNYNKDMKPTLLIIAGIILITATIYGLIWIFLEEFFNLAIKLSGGM